MVFKCLFLFVCLFLVRVINCQENNATMSDEVEIYIFENREDCKNDTLLAMIDFSGKTFITCSTDQHTKEIAHKVRILSNRMSSVHLTHKTKEAKQCL